MRIAALVVGVVLALGVGAGRTQQPADGARLPECPAQLPTDRTEAFGCFCPPQLAAEGEVWGTDIYTDDSRICRAARHQGLLDQGERRDQGPIRVTPLPGQRSYRGSTRNDVTTRDYGEWGRSFSVRPFATQAQPQSPAQQPPQQAQPAPSPAPPPQPAQPTPAQPPQQAQPAPAQPPQQAQPAPQPQQPPPQQTQPAPQPPQQAQPDKPPQQAQRPPLSTARPGPNDPCPATYEQLADQRNPVKCVCTADAVQRGRIWGNDIYSGDSAICRAALHSGAIGTRGGQVTLRPEPGRRSYPSTGRNGVTSESRGSWGMSFRIDKG